MQPDRCHPTHNLSTEEKVERCRSWVANGRFCSEPGNEFDPKRESILDVFRRERAAQRSKHL